MFVCCVTNYVFPLVGSYLFVVGYGVALVTSVIVIAPCFIAPDQNAASL